MGGCGECAARKEAHDNQKKEDSPNQVIKSWNHSKYHANHAPVAAKKGLLKGRLFSGGGGWGGRGANLDGGELNPQIQENGWDIVNEQKLRPKSGYDEG